jgi:K+-transporting ATPase KdpF subunit
MAFDYTLAAIVAAGLLCYLLYALLRPERFQHHRPGFAPKVYGLGPAHFHTQQQCAGLSRWPCPSQV